MADTIIDAGAEVFNYNREGWKFGAQLRQRDLYQRQKMRIKQVALYREDMRDLFDLTVGKMDKYVIVCIVLLALVMELLYRGRSPPGTPSWLFWCWSIFTAGAILYLFQSTWLALIASISAQSFSVRCLTQWLRLPIPSAEEILKGSSKLEDYETAGKLFRIPVLEKADENANGNKGTDPKKVSGPHDLTTDWQLFTSHFDQFNHLHKKWQGYEAYARVCMCLGMNHFLTAMSYFSISEYGLNLQNPWAGLAFVTIFQGLAVIHARLNLNLNFSESLVMVSLVLLPSFFLCIAVTIVLTSVGTSNMDSAPYETVPCVLAIIGILGHMLWIIFFLIQTKSDINGLPVKFSTVWCIDVLGFGMEILKEVQEPVGKSTYNNRLFVAEHAESKPVNSFGLGSGEEDDTVPEKDDSLPPAVVDDKTGRSQLPWVAFKLGSLFVLILWFLALVHTVLISLHVNTGIASISNALPERRLMENEVMIFNLQKSIADSFSIRGIYKNALVADENGVYNTSSFEQIDCPLSSFLIHDIDMVGEEIFVLTRDSHILECETNPRIIGQSSIGRIDSFAIDREGDDDLDVYALIKGVVNYQVVDSDGEKRWIPIITLGAGAFSLSVRMMEMRVLNVPDQELKIFDLGDLNKPPRIRSVWDPDFFWIRVSDEYLAGIGRKDNSRIIVSIS